MCDMRPMELKDTIKMMTSEDYKERRGYDDWDPDRDPQHSMSYNEYRKAKRHYTETKSPSDKQMMDEKSRRHIHEALDTFKDIWKDADPVMRKELKASMQQAINEMPA